MRRLAATLACDLRLQYRHGFHLAAAFTASALILGLARVSDAALDRLLPAVILGQLLITAFLFAAGQVLLEKAEGTLAMRDATPLRPHEYLGAKAASLALVSVLASLVTVLGLRGSSFQPILFLLGAAGAAVLLVLAGFCAVSAHSSPKGFLLLSLPWMAALSLPILPGLGMADSLWLRLHPLDAPMALLRASFLGGAGAGRIAYGLVAPALWALAGLWACKRAFERLRRAGR